MDVRVGEAGEDAAPPEVDAVRAGQRGLVRPDPARDSLAGDCEGGGPRQRRIERPDRPVLEDHDADDSECADAPGDGREVSGGVWREPGRPAPGGTDSPPGADRFDRQRANISGFCWAMAKASVSPVSIMCL